MLSGEAKFEIVLVGIILTVLTALLVHMVDFGDQKSNDKPDRSITSVPCATQSSRESGRFFFVHATRSRPFCVDIRHHVAAQGYDFHTQVP